VDKLIWVFFFEDLELTNPSLLTIRRAIGPRLEALHVEFLSDRTTGRGEVT